MENHTEADQKQLRLLRETKKAMNSQKAEHLAPKRQGGTCYYRMGGLGTSVYEEEDKGDFPPMNTTAAAAVFALVVHLPDDARDEAASSILSRL
ncbi:hypothetical protein EYF80_037510 [Liparis tanakae]|uniref:Uncharacterized protein n=1 Tax=Liparis tanakae TaxID=230148 RepID=A0A4Z2GHA7_9TELE|nr:hypothetical protein EYF80_037510 [Liparis tanakae]